jgi:hypothetical protein
VAPGISPNKDINPGVTFLEIDDHTSDPHGMKMEFLNLEPTLGKTSVSYDELEWRSVDLGSLYGLNSISPSALSDFRHTLEDNDDMTLDYLTRKLGFNPYIEDEFDQAMEIYAKKDLVTSDEHHTGEFICLMHKSSKSGEYDDCTEKANK